MSEEAAAPPTSTYDIRVVDDFSSQEWRLNNLYRVIDDSGKDIAFRMNDMQRLFYDAMWYRNTILKGRQHGFCLDPSTRVLTADLRWVAIGAITAGQEIVAVDENTGGDGTARRTARKMRTGIVQAVREVERDAFRISLDDGRKIICTGQHPWLSKNKRVDPQWRKIESDKRDKLKVGCSIRWITKPWETATYEDGWVGGLIDGEGTLDINSGASIGVTQVKGDVLERLRSYLLAGGYHFQEYIDSRPQGVGSKLGKKDVHRLEICRSNELFRLIGQTRPSRFVPRRWWDGMHLPGKKSGEGWSKIVSIEPLGKRKMIDLQTSTGTYIAEGFVSHNTTFVCILLLDAAVFYPNQTCGIIALTLDDVKKIFRRKIKHPYEKLPTGIKQQVAPTNDTQNELLFTNSSEISVDTGFRGGTYNYLLISEFGKIASVYPEKATEIKVGSFNTVHPGNYIFVESTGHGKGGEFYELTKAARDTAIAGKPLTQLDFKYHFYPWWMNPKYALPMSDAKEVVFTRKDLDYFERVELRMKCRLSLEQRAWYVTQRKYNGEEMLREYPSTPDEPFEAVLKGAIFGEEMALVRATGRIGKVIHQPGIGVDTWWDIGRRDKTAIWFSQQIGNEIRFIWYHEESFKGLPYFVKYCNDRRAEFFWNYRHHLGPHDMDVTEWGSDQTRLKMAAKLGYHFTVGRQFPQDDQIGAARAMLGMCVFDEENCSEGITHLELVRREWNEHNQSYAAAVLHNDHSHGASSFMNGAMMNGYLQKGRPRARTVENRSYPT